MTEAKSGLASVVGWLTQAKELVAAVAMLAGALALLVPERLRAQAAWLQWLALGIAIVAGLWLARSAWRNWRLRVPSRLADASASDTSHIRGPRPFEDGEQLLGRDSETKALLGIVRSLEFRWGYVSGEAGSGKTSLIRAGLLGRIRQALPEWRTLYLPRSGDRPDWAIAARLAEALSLPMPDKGGLAELAAAANAAGQPTTLIVCDQFEEFFLSARTGEARAAVREALRALWLASQSAGRIRLLFSLRKEFVDDLLSLGEGIPGLRFEDWRFPLANLSLDVAEQMIEKIADIGELPVSRQLRPRVAADLAIDGRVRPVEFQIVLSRMLEQGIFELPAYSALGGARGIVSRFIVETIEPPDRKVSEIDRQIGRHLLRALCADNFAARRPVGLSKAELDSRIQHQLSAAVGGTPFVGEEIRASLSRVLEAFCRARVVIEEDEDRLNLAHDYLAAPVRDATADIETAEERANRLLHNYVAQVRTERGTVVPFRPLRQILRYASFEERERTDARALIRRSKHRLAGTAAAAAAALLGLVTWILPHGWTLEEQPGPPMRPSGYLVEDRSLLIRNLPGRTELRDAAGNVVGRIDLPRDLFSPSPTGSMIVFGFSSGPTYFARRRNGFRPELVSDQPGWSRDQSQTWVDYSRDGRLAYVLFPSGDIFLIRDTGPPVRLATIELTGSARASDPVQAPLRPAKVSLSASGRHLAIVDGRHRVLLLTTDRQYPVLPPPIGASASWSLGNLYSDSIEFSPDEQLLAWRGPANWIYARPVDREGRTREAIQLGRAFLVDLRFSPQSDQLLAKTEASLFRWRIGDPVPRQPAVHISSVAEAMIRPLQDAWFDQQGRRVIGTIGGQVYVWEPDRPRTAGVPRIPEAGSIMPGGPTQRGWFCRDSSHALLITRNGRLYRIRLGHSQSIRAVQLLVPGTMQLVRPGTGDDVLVFGQGLVAYGSCHSGSLETLRTDQSVSNVYVGRDRRDLMLITENGTVRVRRSFLVWGIALWSSKWPALERGVE